MAFSVATWNINSVRLRIDLVRHFLQEAAPDVLCLQETKCPDALFPQKPFQEAGYPFLAFAGEKGYNGVAIVSRRPLAKIDRSYFCNREDCRHISAEVTTRAGPLTLHNFYVPAGGDEPDPEKNWKFAHKLAFVEEMTAATERFARPRTILVGDLNIAPLETDVWSHRQLLKVVSHTPVETEGLKRLQAAGKWVDVMRHFVPPEEKLYTWWSYRSPNWEASDRGRRLDHIWASPDLGERALSMQVLKAARSWERPSDHVPVVATFAEE
ncbi:exodeoxyribonuclease III [Afifella pfennigii]|uniref:exodeoxyribonuclease III n=1 Tax=Afifella pfennigii TaxID=209897 RepID=UPI00047C83A9|nr:exodeoxyribonuclease III [Afifella pfennigii]